MCWYIGLTDVKAYRQLFLYPHTQITNQSKIQSLTLHHNIYYCLPHSPADARPQLASACPPIAGHAVQRTDQHLSGWQEPAVIPNQDSRQTAVQGHSGTRVSWKHRRGCTCTHVRSNVLRPSYPSSCIYPQQTPPEYGCYRNSAKHVPVHPEGGLCHS